MLFVGRYIEFQNPATRSCWLRLAEAVRPYIGAKSLTSLWGQFLNEEKIVSMGSINSEH